MVVALAETWLLLGAGVGSPGAACSPVSLNDMVARYFSQSPEPLRAQSLENNVQSWRYCPKFRSSMQTHDQSVAARFGLVLVTDV